MIVPRHSQTPLVDTCGSGLRFDVPAHPRRQVLRREVDFGGAEFFGGTVVFRYPRD
jgi:hypothetical protein